jgi:hypothetical protein
MWRIVRCVTRSAPGPAGWIWIITITIIMTIHTVMGTRMTMGIITTTMITPTRSIPMPNTPMGQKARARRLPINAANPIQMRAKALKLKA